MAFNKIPFYHHHDCNSKPRRFTHRLTAGFDESASLFAHLVIGVLGALRIASLTVATSAGCRAICIFCPRAIRHFLTPMNFARFALFNWLWLAAATGVFAQAHSGLDYNKQQLKELQATNAERTSQILKNRAEQTKLEAQLNQAQTGAARATKAEDKAAFQATIGSIKSEIASVTASTTKQMAEISDNNVAIGKLISAQAGLAKQATRDAANQ